jgi:acetyltransferase
MMEQTKIYTALKGIRGRGPADLGLLERLLVRFSRLVVDNPRIREIDINPLVVSEHDIRALDARIVLYPATVADDELPSSAIRPYPSQYARQWATASGQRFNIRPIRPEDEPKIVVFHRTLSDRTIHNRYFAGLSLQHRIAHERLTRVCGFDYDADIALVAEENDSRDIAAVGRLVRVPGTTASEFAIVVSDEYQHRGIGRELLERLIDIGKAEKMQTIEGWILPTNTAMQHISRTLGFTLTVDPDEGLVRASLPLT